MRKRSSSPMVITMKGIFKGLKIIVKIFMHKEHEIEIGYPTDVRHVSHIGLGGNDSCPSWMREFKGLEEASTGSIECVASQASWASLDFEQRIGMLLPAEVRPDSSIHDAAFFGTSSGPRESTTRAVKKSRSSPASSAARSPSWRSTASFATACEDPGELHSAAPVSA